MCISNSRAFVCVLCIKRIYHKYSLNHILLLFCYTSFIIISAAIFFVVESQSSITYKLEWQDKVNVGRQKFISSNLFPDIFNNSRLLLYVHGEKSDYLQRVIDRRLHNYEQHQLKIQAPVPKFKITYLNSLFYIFSTITTTGHGYIQPGTDNGRTTSIFVSILGIPFTIIVIKDVAYIIAVLLHFPCRLLQTIWNIFRFCTLKPVKESELEQELNNGRVDPAKDYRLDHASRLLSIPVTVAILAVIGWISFGSILMSYAFPSLSNSSNVYFILNCLTTTAVSNIELPELTLLMLIAYFLYVLIGLAIVSLFINLLHTKFSQAYWMPGKMYLPLRNNGGLGRNLATLESFEELTVSDMPINHMATLGIFQTDDKCPLLAILKKEGALHEVVTQTGQENTCILSNNKYLPPIDQSSPTPPLLPSNYSKSQEDVNELIIETYGSKRLMR
ncbi:unnamed protein product [Caenorhabditis angaria]|uniref:Potassium channel domain-containing protein n=1 Tax=Caenorhabditis angaria TaxID=860376 RepID=A0A9P1IDC6_9PELO|nr:unnamed protein product [Caenorhabditis angaria]